MTAPARAALALLGSAVALAGWTVVRFTSASSDDDVAATVAAALAQLGHKAAS